jgi:ketosteroid isomerase-like protein
MAPVASLPDAPLRPPASPGNAAIVRLVYTAFSRLAQNGEVAAYVTRHFDPACEYWPVEEVSPIRGHDALTGWIERWPEAWDDAWDVVEEIIEDGELVVAATRVYGRGRRSGMEISQRLFDVFELRDGKVLRVTEYLDREGALQAAGLVQPQGGRADPLTPHVATAHPDRGS